MDTGEWLTRGSVWLALTLYVGGAIAHASGSGGARRETERWFLTAGCIAFLAHVTCAFQFHHHWSHSEAYAETARQTEAFTGWNWSGGLYLNYLFALIWLGEVVWFWTKPNGYLQRPSWLNRTVRGFFLFMMFNGAVVFVHGAMRWFGLVLCLVLVVCWCFSRARRAPVPVVSDSPGL